MKQILLILAVSLFALDCMADKFVVDGIHYNTIMGYRAEVISPNDDGNKVADYSGEIVIPESVNFNGIDYMVVQIADYAFYNCFELTSVKLPASLKIIGDNAFNGCSKIESLELNEGLTTIGDDNFTGCQISSLSLPSSLTSIGRYCFNSLKIENIVLPDALESIGIQGFSYCQNLQTVYIGSKLNSVDSYFLLNCSKLTNISISEHNNTFSVIDNCLIENSTNTLVRVPGGYTGTYELPYIKKIGIAAIAYCPNITDIIFNEALEEIDYVGCSNNDMLSEITLPNNLKLIGYEAFRHCRNLRKVVLGSSVTNIDGYAFSDCPNLEIIRSLSLTPPRTASGGITDQINYLYTVLEVPNQSLQVYKTSTYDWSKFDNINGFTSYSYPYDIESNGLFFRISSPNSVELIRQEVNNQSVYSGDISIPSSISYSGREYTVSSIEKWAFIYSNITGVIIPSTIKTIGSESFYCCRDLLNVVLNNGVEKIDAGAFSDCRNLEFITIPESLYSIGNAAFDGCASLKDFNFHSNITEIGKMAFRNCGFTSINVPERITEIPDDVFYSCRKLEAVKLHSGITSVGDGAFYDCSLLSYVYCPVNTPPAIYYSSFQKTGNYDYVPISECRLVVPQSAIDLYRDAKYWSDFLIEADPDSGLDDIIYNASSEIEAIYNLQGVQVDENYKGLIIIHFHDGTSIKRIRN